MPGPSINIPSGLPPDLQTALQAIKDRLDGTGGGDGVATTDAPAPATTRPQTISGTPGAQGAQGIFTVHIYRRIPDTSVGDPATPAGGNFEYTTNTLTPPPNWSLVQPVDHVDFFAFESTAQVDPRFRNNPPIWTPPRRLYVRDGKEIVDVRLSTAQDYTDLAVEGGPGPGKYTIVYSDGSLDLFTAPPGAGATVQITDNDDGSTTVRFTDADGNPQNFTIHDGLNGRGIASIARTEDGMVRVTFDMGDPPFMDFPLNERGVVATRLATQEDIDAAGETGEPNERTYAIEYTDQTVDIFMVPEGTKGDKGDPGNSIAIMSIVSNGDGSQTVNFDDGENSITIPPGQAGLGIRTIARVGNKVRVTFDNGTVTEFDIMDGTAGVQGRYIISLWRQIPRGDDTPAAPATDIVPMAAVPAHDAELGVTLVGATTVSNNRIIGLENVADNTVADRLHFFGLAGRAITNPGISVEIEPGNHRAVVAHGDRIWVVNDDTNMAVAYDVGDDNSITRVAAADADIGSSFVSDAWAGAAAIGNHIWFAALNVARSFRVENGMLSLATPLQGLPTQTYRGVVSIGRRIMFLSDSGNLRAYDALDDGTLTRVSSADTVASGSNFQGAFSLASTVWLLTGENARAYEPRPIWDFGAKVFRNVPPGWRTTRPVYVSNQLTYRAFTEADPATGTLDPFQVEQSDLPGADGMDGVGVEEIFAVHTGSTLDNDQLPDNDWPYDQPGTAGDVVWQDGAPSLTVEKPWLWRSSRRVPASVETGDDVDSDWGAPAVVGVHAATTVFSPPRLNTPPTPEGLVGVGGFDKVYLYWDDPRDLYENHALVRVERSQIGEDGPFTELGTGNWLTFEDDNVNPNQHYWYRIRFESAQGALGPYADAVEVVPTLHPDRAIENVKTALFGPPPDERGETRRTKAQTERAALVGLFIDDIANANLAAEAEARGEAVTQVGGRIGDVEGDVTDVKGFIESPTALEDHFNLGMNNERALSRWLVKTRTNDLVGGVGLLNDGVNTFFVVSVDNFVLLPAGVTDINELTERSPFHIRDGLTYIRDVFIENGTIGGLKVGNAFFDEIDAEVARIPQSLLSKLNILQVSVGGFIESDNYEQGESGFHLDINGYAEFNAANIRGTLSADNINARDVSNTVVIYDGGSIGTLLGTQHHEFASVDEIKVDTDDPGLRDGFDLIGIVYGVGAERKSVLIDVASMVTEANRITAGDLTVWRPSSGPSNNRAITILANGQTIYQIYGIRHSRSLFRRYELNETLTWGEGEMMWVQNSTMVEIHIVAGSGGQGGTGGTGGRPGRGTPGGAGGEGGEHAAGGQSNPGGRGGAGRTGGSNSGAGGGGGGAGGDGQNTEITVARVDHQSQTFVALGGRGGGGGGGGGGAAGEDVVDESSEETPLTSSGWSGPGGGGGGGQEGPGQTGEGEIGTGPGGAGGAGGAPDGVDGIRGRRFSYEFDIPHGTVGRFGIPGEIRELPPFSIQRGDTITLSIGGGGLGGQGGGRGGLVDGGRAPTGARGADGYVLIRPL